MSDVHLDIADSGSGPAVVLTPGWLDTREVWDGVVTELSDDVHCFSWSLRGHGESATPPPGNYTRDHALEDLGRVIRAAGTPAVLVGHSLGGYLSLAYALDHPDDVRGLVLVAAGPGFRKVEAREQWNASVDSSAEKFGVPEGSEVISKHYDSWVIDNLGEITAPSLVIVGERDKRFAASAAVFDKYLDVRSNIVIADAGHGVHRDQPEAVADAIREFTAAL